MNWEQTVLFLGVFVGAVGATYAKVHSAWLVITGGKNLPNLRELITKRLDEHESRLDELETFKVRYYRERLPSQQDGGE